MDQTLDIVIPVFGLIALGYGAAWTGLLRRDTGEGLSDFVFSIAIPVLIFRTIAEADFSGTAPWRIWLPFFAVFAVNWVAGDLLVRRLFGRDARAGLVAGVSAAYGNTVMVGIPMTLAAFGDEGVVPIALIIAVHLPVMMTASAVLIDRAEAADGVAGATTDARAKARTVFVSLAGNPIIIGVAAGVLWRLSGVALSGVAATLIDRLSDLAATLALFAMGMSLRKYGVSGNVRAGLVLSALKLLLMPALVFLLARYVVPMPPAWAKVVVIASACPTGVNAYLVASRFGTGQALSSNAITISTALAVLSMAFWLAVVQTF